MVSRVGSIKPLIHAVRALWPIGAQVGRALTTKQYGPGRICRLDELEKSEGALAPVANGRQPVKHESAIMGMNFAVTKLCTISTKGISTPNTTVLLHSLLLLLQLLLLSSPSQCLPVSSHKQASNSTILRLQLSNQLLHTCPFFAPSRLFSSKLRSDLKERECAIHTTSRQSLSLRLLPRNPI